MRVIEHGSGPPLVLIPGLQGRWEYVRQTFEALSASFRVITFPLGDEPSAEFNFDPARGFDSYVDQAQLALDRTGAGDAIVCGISFGGLIALRFAVRHPDRTTGLVLASTPGPGWHLRKRHEIYARIPWVFGPVFLAETPWRLRLELRAAFPAPAARLRFAASQLRTLLEAPLSLSRMAARARLISTIDWASECTRVTSRTLVVTGEPELDHVVNVDGSNGYARLIAGANLSVVGRTGHLGSITRPDAFAAIISDFANQLAVNSPRSAVRGRLQTGDCRLPTDEHVA